MAVVNLTCLTKGHDWNGCKCKRCGKIRSEGLDIYHCGDICSICGNIIDHKWHVIEKTNYGAMDYDSAGRSVEDYVETFRKCLVCGLLEKAATGDFCGDDSDYTNITEKERQMYG